MKRKSSQKVQLQVIDYESDPDIHEAVDQILEEERKSHASDFEPFEAKAAKLRLSIGQELYNFKKTYNLGYQVLMHELAEMYADSVDENPLAPFEVDNVHLATLEDKEACTTRMQEGTPLSDILGYSQETLTKFYGAATSLLEKNQLQEAKDAFYFLATIAPHYPLFWLGLGYSLALVNEHETAVKACDFALQLDPNNADCYLIYARIYLQFNEHDNAIRVIQRGIEHANAHKNEPWANDLVAMMQEAITFIQANRNVR